MNVSRFVVVLLLVMGFATAKLPAQGGGRGGPPPDPENILARTATLKNQLMGIWETPSAAMVAQYTEAKTDLPKAIADANAWLTRAAAVGQALKKYDITLAVPPPVK